MTPDDWIEDEPCREWSAVTEEEREDANASIDAAIASTPPDHPDSEKLTP